MRRWFILPALLSLLVAIAWAPPAIQAEDGDPDGESSVLVDYHHSGGFAGVQDHLVIDTSGNATLRQRRGEPIAFVVSAEDLAELRERLDAAGFAHLAEEYLPTGTIYDGMDYVVRYAGKSVHTVTTAVPPALEPVLETLDRLITLAPAAHP